MSTIALALGNTVRNIGGHKGRRVDMLAFEFQSKEEAETALSKIGESMETKNFLVFEGEFQKVVATQDA